MPQKPVLPLQPPPSVPKLSLSPEEQAAMKARVQQAAEERWGQNPAIVRGVASFLGLPSPYEYLSPRADKATQVGEWTNTLTGIHLPGGAAAAAVVPFGRELQSFLSDGLDSIVRRHAALEAGPFASPADSRITKLREAHNVFAGADTTLPYVAEAQKSGLIKHVQGGIRAALKDILDNKAVRLPHPSDLTATEYAQTPPWDLGRVARRIVEPVSDAELARARQALDTDTIPMYRGLSSPRIANQGPGMSPIEPGYRPMSLDPRTAENFSGYRPVQHTEPYLPNEYRTLGGPGSVVGGRVPIDIIQVPGTNSEFELLVNADKMPFDALRPMRSQATPGHRTSVPDPHIYSSLLPPEFIERFGNIRPERVRAFPGDQRGARRAHLATKAAEDVISGLGGGDVLRAVREWFGRGDRNNFAGMALRQTSQAHDPTSRMIYSILQSNDITVNDPFNAMQDRLPPWFMASLFTPREARDNISPQMDLIKRFEALAEQLGLASSHVRTGAVARIPPPPHLWPKPER